MSHRVLIANRIVLIMLASGLALAVLGQKPTVTTLRELRPGQTLEREMSGAQVHRYDIRLSNGQFFQVRLDQKGIDVLLRLIDAAGNVMAKMDSPNSKQGPETLSFIPVKSQTFTLEVACADPKSPKGTYSIQRSANRTATAKDKQRVEIEGIFVSGITEIDKQDSHARDKLLEARNGWFELADTYMAGLASQQLVSLIVRDRNKELQVAQTLLAEGQKLAFRSKSDSLTARAKLDEVLTMYRTLNKSLESELINDTVFQFDDASRLGLKHLRIVQLNSKAGEALALNAIAQTHRNLGEWLQEVANLKLSIGAYENLIKDLHAALNSGLDQKQHLIAVKGVTATALENLGGTLTTIGRPAEAREYFDRAVVYYRALFEETNDPKFKFSEAQAMQMTGLSYGSDSKDRKRTIEYLSKALFIYRSLPETKLNEADLLTLIGSHNSLDFNYEAALSKWSEALEIYQKLDDKSGQVSVLQSKGAMYSLLDDHQKLRESFSEILSVLNSSDYAPSYKKKHFNFALSDPHWSQMADMFIEYVRLDRTAYAHEMLGEYDKAIVHYQKALTIARARNNTLDVRGQLSSIGFVYTQLKQWDNAYQYYRQALDISREGKVKENVADDLARVGLTLLESGKAKEALPFQNEGLALYLSAGVGSNDVFTPRFSPLLNELGRTHYQLGNRRLAIFYGKQAINSLQGERNRLRNFDAQSQRGFLGKMEKHYRRLAAWLIEDGRITEAEQVLGMLKEEEVFEYLRRDVSESEKLKQRADLSPAERDALERYSNLAARIAAIGSEFAELQKLGTSRTSEQETRFKELATQVEDANYIFQAFLKQLSEEFAARSNTQKDLQENLALQSDLKEWGNGVVFLYTLVGEERYRVILVTPETQVDAKHEIKEIDLNRKIESFRQAVTNPHEDPRPLGKELYDILIKPIEKQLEGGRARTLLWSLDGNLRLLPLSALWDGKQYFGQRYQNVTITLASRTRLGDAVATNWRALALGVSEAKTVTVKQISGESSEFPFGALPAVKAELRSIVKSEGSPSGVLPGRSLLDGDFNRTALETHLTDGYKLVHIASHFSVNPGDATRSFLLLGDGNVLTVDTMRNNPRIRFTGVELLTLSACQTAVVGKDSSGKEIEGFGYVAQQKGAKAILATLWSVADESTQLLMTDFYRLRRQKPHLTKAAALQLAQQRMIQGQLRPLTSKAKQRGLSISEDFAYDQKRPYAHPYYWSPFILIGNWR